MPIEVAKQSPGAETTRKKNVPLRGMLARRSVADSDRLFFTEQLSLLLETGSNLHQALQSLRDQLGDGAMGDVVSDLVDAVADGRSFSAALARHPRVFSPAYVNLIRASEGGGFMHEVLEELLSMEEKRQDLRNTVVSALSYPAFLVLFSVGVVVFVLVVVFPKFSEMFARIHDQLPATTLALMSASDFLRGHWVATLVALTAGILLAARWRTSAGGRALIDRCKLTFPGTRAIVIEVYLVQLLRVMALSLRNGVPMLDTLRATRDVVDNALIRDLFQRIEAGVQQGRGLTSGFNSSPFVPPLARQLIATGESSGNLPRVLNRLADYYEKELRKKLTSLSKMAEPLMLMVMGLIVGIIVSSLILPIFKLSRAVT